MTQTDLEQKTAKEMTRRDLLKASVATIFTLSSFAYLDHTLKDKPQETSTQREFRFIPYEDLINPSAEQLPYPLELIETEFIPSKDSVMFPNSNFTGYRKNNDESPQMHEKLFLKSEDGRLTANIFSYENRRSQYANAEADLLNAAQQGSPIRFRGAIEYARPSSISLIGESIKLPKNNDFRILASNFDYNLRELRDYLMSEL